VEKFLSVKSDVERIHVLAEQLKEAPDGRIIGQIEEISSDILSII
jgi:hypothetical protein